MGDRSLRRHHEERIKKRVGNYHGAFARGNPRQIGRIAHAKQLCSCAMCGNPRRYFGELTVGSIRVLDKCGFNVEQRVEVASDGVVELVLVLR